MDQQNDLNTYLNALDTVRRTEPSEAYLGKLEALAVGYVNQKKKAARTFIIGIAASFLLLIMSNVYTVTKANNTPTSHPAVQSYYDSIIPIKSLYNE